MNLKLNLKDGEVETEVKSISKKGRYSWIMKIWHMRKHTRD
jgi:hypothetical protein